MNISGKTFHLVFLFFDILITLTRRLSSANSCLDGVKLDANPETLYTLSRTGRRPHYIDGTYSQRCIIAARSVSAQPACSDSPVMRGS